MGLAQTITEATATTKQSHRATTAAIRQILQRKIGNVMLNFYLRVAPILLCFLTSPLRPLIRQHPKKLSAKQEMQKSEVVL